MSELPPRTRAAFRKWNWNALLDECKALELELMATTKELADAQREILRVMNERNAECKLRQAAEARTK